MFLDKDTFSNIVENAPLISIDLIVRNHIGQVLLGQRVNEPAKNSWFVPGGRIFKNETLEDAFSRTVKEELGLEMQKDDSEFYGLYEHFYKNNVFDDKFSTHYVVLAHVIKIDTTPKLNLQHSSYKWFDIDELLEDESVYSYTKDYFKNK